MAAPGRAPLTVPLLAVAAAVLLVVIDRFFALWLLTWLWVFAFLVDAAVALVALGLVGYALVALVRRARRGVAVAAGAVVLSLVVAGVVVNWPLTFARGWFALHRSGFAEVAVAARAGAYGPLDEAPYYGYPLPGSLRALSVNGSVAVCGQAGGQAVLLVPAWIGIPDGGGGFMHLTAPVDGSPDAPCDAFGDTALPRVELGDGWWWTG